MTELSRLLALDRVGAGVLEQAVAARPEELAPLAARMRLPAVNGLRCTFGLRRVAEGVIEAAGTLEAEVVQMCVVSLEEFAQTVRETFVVYFVPAGTEADDDDLETPDQIPYSANAIDLGEAAAQQLALALDPYPHGPEAGAPSDEAAEPGGAFAGLTALRLKQ